jgi:hypothetical protein
MGSVSPEKETRLLKGMLTKIKEAIHGLGMES